MGRHSRTPEDEIVLTADRVTEAIEEHLRARATYAGQPEPLVADWLVSIKAALPSETDPLANPVLVAFTRDTTTNEAAHQLAIGAAMMIAKKAHQESGCEECEGQH